MSSSDDESDNLLKQDDLNSLQESVKESVEQIKVRQMEMANNYKGIIYI